MNFIFGMMCGAGIGIILAFIIMCVGGSDHEQEAYKSGYDRGYFEGMMEARNIWKEEK